MCSTFLRFHFCAKRINRDNPTAGPSPTAHQRGPDGTRRRPDATQTKKRAKTMPASPCKAPRSTTRCQAGDNVGLELKAASWRAQRLRRSTTDSAGASVHLRGAGEASAGQSQHTVMGACSVQLQARIAAHLRGLLGQLLAIRPSEAPGLPERREPSRNSRRDRPKVLLSEARIRGSDGAKMSLSAASLFDCGASRTRIGPP